VDSRFRLGINLTNGKGHCFNCDWKSRHTISYLLQRIGFEGEVLEAEEEQETPPPPKVRLPEGFAPLTEACDVLDRTALRYLLQDRRLSRRQIQTKGVGVSYLGRYAYRVIFPVRDQERKLRGFVARSFVGGQPKYLNSPGDKYLYNLNHKSKQIVLAEGVFKALRLELALPEFNCCALLGHDLTVTQTQQLADTKCRHVVLWPDPDRIGVQGVSRIARQLLETGYQVELIWPVVRPADEAPLSELQQLMLQRRSYSWQMGEKLLLSV
jgi:hypothetical protein